MSLIKKIKQILTNTMFHGTETYFDLPKNEFDVPSPQHEGPFGSSLSKSISLFKKLTRSGGHGSPAFYLIIGVILSILTYIEFAIFYVESLGALMIPLLIILSLGKFILVVALFMHLRFDNKLLTYIFATGFVLAILIFLILMILQAF